jgi:hypothetical protein
MGQSISKPTEPNGSERSLVLDLPDPLPITEVELRALEILLGASLKDLLAKMPDKPLKSRAD